MKIKYCLLLIIFAFLFIFPQTASAEKINSFDVVITAQKNGLMNITETIVYDFEDLDRHGIFRFIPLYSKVGDLYRVLEIDNVVVSRNGQSEKFETTKDKEQVSFKLGDPKKTIKGEHVYKISYSVKNGIGSNYETHDEIYWNVTGNNWQVLIEKASITFNTGFGLFPDDIVCFTGEEGSTEANCLAEGNKVLAESLFPGQGLTAAAKYPKNTFPPSTLVRELPKTNTERILQFIIAKLPLIWLVMNLILPGALFYWYQKKKNKKRFGAPAVHFDIPKDQKGERLAPALAGTIDSATLQRDDILATLFDLAIRRYVRLEEVKTKRDLLPDSKKQKIIKLKNDDGKLSAFEKKLFDRLFKKGNDVDVSDLKKDFYKTYQELEREAFRELVSRKYFVKNPKAQRGFLLVFGLMALFSTNLILGSVLIYLSRKLIGRTTLGDEMDFKIDGLKLFLKSMDRNYKWQAEKFYTIEQMIPYAIALGYIDKFMKQLKIIKPDYNPSWYRGYSGGFYMFYGSFFSSVNSNMTTSAPKSSSGFSGGGSSGGGGGGGGGGSW